MNYSQPGYQAPMGHTPTRNTLEVILDDTSTRIISSAHPIHINTLVNMGLKMLARDPMYASYFCDSPQQLQQLQQVQQTQVQQAPAQAPVPQQESPKPKINLGLF
jgi:hypothetical protein